MNARTKARSLAKAIIRVDYRHKDAPLLAVCEKLDEYDDMKELSFRTLFGACRAAARSLGRLSKDGERITCED